MTILTALELLDRLGPVAPISDRVEYEDVVPAQSHTGAPAPVTYTEPDVLSITTTSDLAAQVNRLVGASAVGLDLETTGLDPHTDLIRLVTLAAEDVAYVIDARSCADWAAVLKPLLADACTTKVLHHAAFD